MDVVCNWFLSRDWEQFFSVVGTVATVAGCLIAVCIYKKWITQKKYEVIANEAGRIVEEIYILRNEVLKLHTYKANHLEIIALGEKRDFIEEALNTIYAELSKLKSIKNNRIKAYIASLTDFIRDVQSNSDCTQTLLKNMSCSKALAKDLSRLKFFHFDI